MKLNELRDKIHENAKAKGFYDVKNSIINFGIGTSEEELIRHSLFAQKIALIHSELSEALEADRINVCETPVEILNDLRSEFNKLDFIILYNKFVGNTRSAELADVIIRTLDLCGHLGIDIEKHVQLKMRYNESREYKHGKKY